MLLTLCECCCKCSENVSESVPMCLDSIVAICTTVLLCIIVVCVFLFCIFRKYCEHKKEIQREQHAQEGKIRDDNAKTDEKKDKELQKSKENALRLRVLEFNMINFPAKALEKLDYSEMTAEEVLRVIEQLNENTNRILKED